MKVYQTYRCNICKNEVEVQRVGGGTLSCCDNKMELITKNLTQVNLMKAFSGESQARNKYEFFSESAFNEGHTKIARFFQEIASNEKYHAVAEFRAYNQLTYNVEMNSTLKNLELAIDGEKYEYSSMYPSFSETALEEGYEDIAKMFEAIGKVEIKHERAFTELIESLRQEELKIKSEKKWYCEVCWHVHKGEKPPGSCPLCLAGKEYFSEGDYFSNKNNNH